MCSEIFLQSNKSLSEKNRVVKSYASLIHKYSGNDFSKDKCKCLNMHVSKEFLQ